MVLMTLFKLKICCLRIKGEAAEGVLNCTTKGGGRVAFVRALCKRYFWEVIAILWSHGTAHRRVHQYCNKDCNLTSLIFGATLCLSNQQTCTCNEVNLADEDVSKCHPVSRNDGPGT